MTTQTLNTRSDNLTSEMGVSLGLHLLVAVVMLFKFILFPGEPLVMQQAIRVDLIGLPDKLPPAPVSSATPEASKPTPAKVEIPKKELSPKANHKVQDAALERIKALQEIETQMQNDEAHKRAVAKAPTYKGLVLSPGTQLTGVDKLSHDAYLGDLDAHVKKNWMLPQWLKNSQLKARVLVLLDPSGNVLKKQITQSSGNSMYDEKVLEAIDRATPFPKPPDKFIRILEFQGVEFGFPE